MLQVTVESAEDVGTGVLVEDMNQHGDHDHTGHGADHMGSHVTTLKNVKRWIDEVSLTQTYIIHPRTLNSWRLVLNAIAYMFCRCQIAQAKEDVDATSALYEILLTSMKTQFIHEREDGMLSVRAFGRLNSAIGLGFDMNQLELDAQAQVDLAAGIGGSAATRMAKQAEESEGLGSPLDATVDTVLDFAKNGTPTCGGMLPQVFFQHRQTALEMLFAILRVLNDFADVDASDIGDGFHSKVLNATGRCRRQLTDMQEEAPQVLKAAHTLVAFGVVTAEFRHRLHMYQDQGFFHEAVVDGVQSELENRRRELSRYVHVDSFWGILGFLTCWKFQGDHPVVAVVKQDAVSRNNWKNGTTADDYENPVLDVEEEEGAEFGDAGVKSKSELRKEKKLAASADSDIG
jgi:hypothetical protein